MNKQLIVLIGLTLCGMLYAQQIDTKTVITNFFQLSQNDFEIDSKSKIPAEKKAYNDLKAADVDGGKTDGVITYSEYLTYLNKNKPGDISEFDFALSKLLPFLKDFTFTSGDFIATGVIDQPLVVSKGLILPAGSRLSISTWGSLRGYMPSDTVLNGIPVRGGKDTPVELYLSSEGFFLAGVQLAKDTVINGVPCKATIVEPWNVNIELLPNGFVTKATLSDKYTDVTTGLVFMPGEKIAYSWPGTVLTAAVLSQSRIIQGKNVVAYNPSRPEKGLWSGDLPNIYFKEGLVTLCYEENKVLYGNIIPGVQQYQYGADGKTVIGIIPVNSYFLGYPVVLNKILPPWDWNTQPTPTVTVADGKAQFTIDVGLQISGKSGVVNLPAGTKITIDIRTGACLSALFPDGKILTYDAVRDQMKPAQFSLEEQPLQIRTWMEQWLNDHPEAADGSNSGIRQAHLVVKERVSAAALATRMLQGVLLYKDKAKGLVAGNVALDINGDGKIQTSELVPDTVLEKDATNFSLEKILEYLIYNGVDRLPKARLQAMGEVMSTFPVFDPRKDSLGVFDILGSVLSKNGIHPFSSRRIYYFPNGSGDKVICDYINFYKSTGSPMQLTIDVFTPTRDSDFSIWVSLPGVPGKVHVFLYDNEKVQESVLHRQKGDYIEYWRSKGKDPNYWGIINEFTFYESGAMESYHGIPFLDNFPELPLPAGVSWRMGPDGYPPIPNVAEWNPDGQLVAIYEPNGYFDLPGGITVERPKWIRWFDNAPQGKILVACDMNHLVTLTMKKGTYTLYRFVDDKWVPYTKTFAADTKLTVQGFILDDKGNITSYW